MLALQINMCNEEKSTLEESQVTTLRVFSYKSNLGLPTYFGDCVPHVFSAVWPRSPDNLRDSASCM